MNDSNAIRRRVLGLAPPGPSVTKEYVEQQMVPTYPYVWCQSETQLVCTHPMCQQKAQQKAREKAEQELSEDLDSEDLDYVRESLGLAPGTEL